MFRMSFAACGLIAATAMTAALPAQARDLALVLGNTDYDEMQAVQTDMRIDDFTNRLEDAGFDVISGEDLPAEGLVEKAGQMLEGMDDVDSVLIVLAGHVVSSATDSWLLGVDADAPNVIDIGREGVSVSGLAHAVAREKPGRTVVMVAAADTSDDLGKGLENGLAWGSEKGDLPDGVTLVEGKVKNLLNVLDGGLLQHDVALSKALAAGGSDLTVEGYTSRQRAFLTGEATDDQLNVELGFWQAIDGIGTISSYESYLKQYPNGDHAAAAKKAIARLRDAPARRAEAAEDALNLSRSERVQVQKDLTLLGYDTRGTEGIFGPGTRKAIASWQGDQGLAKTSFLTASEVRTLRDLAAARQARLDAEATRNHEKKQAEDRAYWQETGSSGDEADLKRYLDRYPDGQYAEKARGELSKIEAKRNEEADKGKAADRAAWSEAEAKRSREAYENYLSRFPNGMFAKPAKQRLSQLKRGLIEEGGDSKAHTKVETDRAQEKAAAGALPARLLIEKRLQQLGMNPGPADGTFDKRTRKAIRAFQKSVGLPQTGYAGQSTMLKLITR